MKRKLAIFTTILLTISAFLLPTSLHAKEPEIIDDKEWERDENILSFEEKYNFPEEIVIVPIKTQSLPSTSTDAMKELYYYFASRSGIGDLPFHYVVFPDGSIFSGNSLGDEALITLGDTTGSLFIGYVQENSDGPNVASINSIKELALSLANKYRIAPSAISLQEFTFKKDEKGKIKNISFAEIPREWIDAIKLIQTNVKKDYNPVKLAYKVKVKGLVPPKDPQNPTGVASAKLTIENTGKYSIYGGAGANVLVKSKNKERSRFYVSDSWDTPNSVSLLSESRRLEAGEEDEFSFELYVPLYPPEYSEKFVLIGPNGKAIKGSEFTVKVKIKETSKSIVEITETSVGYLNVRKSPGVGEVITKVSPGDRFVVLNSKPGYFQIDANGKKGWISSEYARRVE